MTECRLHLVEFPARFEELRPELVPKIVEVQIVDPGFPTGDVPPGIREASRHELRKLYVANIVGVEEPIMVVLVPDGLTERTWCSAMMSRPAFHR